MLAVLLAVRLWVFVVVGCSRVVWGWGWVGWRGASVLYADGTPINFILPCTSASPPLPPALRAHMQGASSEHAHMQWIIHYPVAPDTHVPLCYFLDVPFRRGVTRCAHSAVVPLFSFPRRSGQAGVDVNTPPAPPSYTDLGAYPLLVVGDAAVFLLFAAIGAASHASNASPLTVAATAAPFALTWFAIAPLMGAYSRRAVATYQGAAVTTARGWLVGVPSGLALRGVLTSHLPPPAFAIVTLLSTAVLLGAWRGFFVKVRGVEGAEGKQGSVLDGFRMITTLLRRW